jgi:hypothetical protein
MEPAPPHSTGKLQTVTNRCATEYSSVQSLDLGRATVDEELDAVDEARIIGGEEEGYGGDLLGTTHFPAGDKGFEALLGGGAEGIEDGRVDGAGAQNIHTNSAILEFEEPGTREGSDGSFAGAVDAKRREPFDAGDGAIQDDRAVVIEQGQRFLCGEERSANVEIKRFVKVFFRDLFERREVALTGAGEEDVDLAFFAFNRFVESVEVGKIGGVALDACDAFADELYGLIELPLAASGDEDVSTLFHEEFSCCQRHPRGSCGDHRYFSFKFFHDCYPFKRVDGSGEKKIH